MNSDMKHSMKWNEQFAKKWERTILKHAREKVKKPIKVRKWREKKLANLELKKIEEPENEEKCKRQTEHIKNVECDPSIYISSIHKCANKMSIKVN